jgi:hypothetical protein
MRLLIFSVGNVEVIFIKAVMVNGMDLDSKLYVIANVTEAKK